MQFSGLTLDLLYKLSIGAQQISSKLGSSKQTFISHFCGQGSRSGLVGWFWLRVSHEVVNQDFGWSCIHLKASQVLKDLSSSSSYGHWKETYIFTSCWLDISVRTMWASSKAAQLTLKHGSWLPPE